MDAMEGETQMISRILPEPIKDSLRILVSLESRTGMWVRDWMVKDLMGREVRRCSGRAWRDCR